ncbi:MAG: AbrB/MazE/SpoVT family DNA-binding domain-containing protein [Rubrivivax sp.]|nr:AbrB/MazE/SpoVT family DNA-binding domain-containing protein [Rubrivivax sp.]
MTFAKNFTHEGSQTVHPPKAPRFGAIEACERRGGVDRRPCPIPSANLRSLIDALNNFEPGMRLLRDQEDEQLRDELALKRRDQSPCAL